MSLVTLVSPGPSGSKVAQRWIYHHPLYKNFQKLLVIQWLVTMIIGYPILVELVTERHETSRAFNLTNIMKCPKAESKRNLSNNMKRASIRNVVGVSNRSLALGDSFCEI